MTGILHHRILGDHQNLGINSYSGAICIGGIVTKLARFYRIALDPLPSTPPVLLDDTFIKNSKQFISINEVWVWTHDIGESEHMNAIFQEIDEFEGQEEDHYTQPSHPQRKRSRHEGTSQGP